MKKMNSTIRFLLSALLATFAFVPPTIAVASEDKVVVPDKVTVRFSHNGSPVVLWHDSANGNAPMSTREFKVGEPYWYRYSFSEMATYVTGQSLPTLSRFSEEEENDDTIDTHHFFNGWQSGGTIVRSYEMVRTGVSHLESSWSEIKGGKTFFRVGGTVEICGLDTGTAVTYDHDTVVEKSLGANATLYRGKDWNIGTIKIKDAIDKEALEDFRAGTGPANPESPVAVWITGSVSCYRYTVWADEHGQKHYIWSDPQESHPDKACSFDVDLVIVTSSGHQLNRIGLGTVSLPTECFYGFNDSSSAHFRIHHKIPASLFTRGESYRLIYEFNRSHLLHTDTYPTAATFTLESQLQYAVRNFNVSATSADAGAGSLTLSWNKPEFVDPWTGIPLGAEKTAEILQGATYSIWRTKGNVNPVHTENLMRVDDAFVQDMECVESACQGLQFEDKTFGSLGGNKPIYYYVVLNGGPKDARFADTFPHLGSTIYCATHVRHRYTISLGLSEYGRAEWKDMQHKHDANEAGDFGFVQYVHEGYDDPYYYNRTNSNVKLLNENCKKADVALAFAKIANSELVKPGDEIFFFLATHGNPEALQLYDALWTKDDVKKCVGMFEGKGIKFVGIINACHSGAIIKEFEDNRFNFTTWVAAADNEMLACCYDVVSGFGKTFLENGWGKGYAKLSEVFSRNNIMERTGATDTDRRLSLANVVKYTDLLWTGRSTKTITCHQWPERCEQHPVTVRPEMQECITVREVAPEDLLFQAPSAPKLSVFNDKFLNEEQNIAYVGIVGVDGVPASSFYRLWYGTNPDDWAVDFKTARRFYFFTPCQWNAIYGARFNKFGMITEIIDNPRRSCINHCLEPGRTYDVSAQVLGCGGWGPEGESVKITMPTDAEWLVNAIEGKSVYARFVNSFGDLKDDVSNNLASMYIAVTIKLFSYKDKVVASVFAENTSDGYFDSFIFEGQDTNGYGYDDVMPVSIDREKGVIMGDMGVVSTEFHPDSDENSFKLRGRMVFTVTPNGITGQWGSTRFEGGVFVDPAQYPGLSEFIDQVVQITPGVDDESALPKTYSFVTFEANGGTGVMEDQLFTIGESAPLVSNRYWRTGSEFLGWATSPRGDVVWADSALASFDVDTKLYARWSDDGGGEAPAPVSVVAKVADGQKTIGTVSGGGVFTSGALVVLNAKAKAGNWFKGWYTEGGLLVSARPDFTYDTFNGSATFVAHFATKADDAASLAINLAERYTPDEYGYFALYLPELVTSAYTEATISVAGLPDGLYFENGMIWGKVWEPGVHAMTVTAKNGSNTKGVSATLYLVVANEIPQMFVGAGLVDGYVTTGESVPALDAVLAALVEQGWDVSVTGLPAGMKYDAAAHSIIGAATKEGTSMITITAENFLDYSRATTALTVRFPKLSVEVARGQENLGSVTGGGAYPVGKVVTLKATVKNKSIFAGWFTMNGSDPLSLLASFKYTTTGDDTSIVAMFTTAAEDAESLKIAVEDLTTEADGSIGTLGADGTRSFDLGACVTSLSLPKLTVSGLPAGLKFDAKTNRITGKATKPGIYAVTVKATNASVTKATDATTATFKLTVPNFACGALPGLLADADAYGMVRVGVAFGADRIDCTAEKDWSVKVAGLPAGLKYDAKTGKITGIPTAKPGAYTVTFTATKKGEKNQIATITLNVEALPDWSVGSFTGYVEPGDYGLATMTVAANGKISGKIQHGGTNWTFKADSFSRVEHVERVDEISISIETNFVINVVATAGKAKREMELHVTDGSGGRGATALPGMINAKVEGATEDGAQTFSLWRTIWKDKATADAAKRTLAEWEGTYNVSLGADENSGYGSGYLSLAVGKDGNVKATGKLADGTSISATSPLMYDAEHGYFILVYAAPSAYMGGSFALSISFDAPKGALGNSVEVSKWSSRNPQATGEYGEGFARWVSFFGSYYDKNASLTNFYDRLTFELAELPLLVASCKRTYYDENDRKVTETQQGEAAPVYLLSQDGLTVSVNAKGTGFDVLKATKPVQDKITKRWNYPGPNDGGLTLTFDPKTGILKGTYTFWYDYLSVNDEIAGKETWAHTSKKVSFEGLMVQGESPRGFYLREESSSYADSKPGKPKTYKYKSSHGIHFTSPDSGWRRLNSEGEWRYSVSVRRGDEHTFWVDSLSPGTSVMGIDVEGSYTYLKDGEEHEVLVGASQGGVISDKDGNLTGFFVTLTTDDWFVDEYTPKNVKFKVTVDGFYDESTMINNKFKFHHVRGKGAFPNE